MWISGKSLNESFVDFGWWKVRAGNPKRKNKNPKIPEFPKGSHMQSISAWSQGRRIWSAAQCRDEGQRTCHPTHGVDGAAFVPGNTTRAFSCNPHASPLGTLQPPRHTWCVCNALGKARPGASSRLARNRRSAWSKAYSVIDGASRHRSPPRLRRTASSRANESVTHERNCSNCGRVNTTAARTSLESNDTRKIPGYAS